jgi:MYXO-CTERM domain-containing protein
MRGGLADHAALMTRRAWIRLGIALIATLSSSSLAHAGGGPLWQDQPGVFGTQPCGGSGCYTNYMRIADLDGDGDLDIIYPNDGGAAEPLVIYANDGAGGFTDVSDSAVGGHTGSIREVAIGDIDGDGDLDLYAPEATLALGAMFVNDGDGNFVDEADMRLPAPTIATGSTRFGDLDDDGDLDLVVADHDFGGLALVYLNDGAGNFSELADAIPFDVGDDMNDMDLLDVDRDFDLDLLTNSHGGTDRIWINDGSGVFGSSAFASSGGLHYGPGVCDVDGDGDLDIWIDNQGPDYTERLWANDGTGSFTDVTVAQVVGNPGVDDNGIVCADVDSDGDFDAVVVALGTPERLLVNDGDGGFTYQAGAFSGPIDSTLGAEMGDLDGDHRIDIATGEGESGSFLNRVFLATAALPIDDTAPRIIVVGDPPAQAIGPGELGVIHYAVSDDALSDHGPRLASAYASIDPRGLAQQVPAFFMGGDLFRVELPSAGLDGEVTFRLCAEDPAGNSACSDDLVYQVAGGGTTSSSTGAESSDATASGGSDDSTTAVADTSGSDGGSTGAGPTTTAATTVSADSGDEDSTGSPEDMPSNDGCGCSSEARRTPLALFVLAALRRRQRRAPASIQRASAT